jgi:hypothetical protein
LSSSVGLGIFIGVLLHIRSDHSTPSPAPPGLPDCPVVDDHDAFPTYGIQGFG